MRGSIAIRGYRRKCPSCGKWGYLINEEKAEYRCKSCGEVFRVVGKVKLRRVPLPITIEKEIDGVKYKVTFEPKPIPLFFLNALGIAQDDDLSLWYQKEWKIIFNLKTLKARLEIDGKTIYIEDLKVES